TADPSVQKAAGFAKEIREAAGPKKLVYNLSPSFNWMGHGFTEEALRNFIWDLAKEGLSVAGMRGSRCSTSPQSASFQYQELTISPSFVLQLISLAGLHSTATITHELSKAYKTEGMLAYVNLVQRREKELGCDVLTHQKWSGAQYMDGILGSIQSGSSGSRSMGEGNTEGSKYRPLIIWRFKQLPIRPIERMLVEAAHNGKAAWIV
ncbi:hypothetical protein LTR28_005016, partial [Elasticomyces elasticus]